MGTLVVEINKGNINISDLYCVIKYGATRYETEVCKTVNPVWNVKYEFEVNEINTIVLNCYTKNVIGRTHIGEVLINVDDYINISMCYAKKHKYPLTCYNKNKVSGEIELKIGNKNKRELVKIVKGENIEEIEQNTKTLSKEANDIVHNILNIAKQSTEIGEGIIKKLSDDEQRIFNLNCETDSIRNNIIQGSRRVRSIKSPFGTLANKFTKAKYADSKVKSKADRKMLKQERKEDRKIIRQPTSTRMVPDIEVNSEIRESYISYMNDTDKVLDQLDLVLDDMACIAKEIGNKIETQNERLDILKKDMAEIDPKIRKLVQETKKLA